MKKRIAIFASGTGTNAQNLIRYFKNSPAGEVVLVLSNKSDAKVLEKAESEGVTSCSFSRPDLYDTGVVLDRLESHSVDLIVLAGFLWKFPHHILHEYPGKVVNIHPALLPKYGGKGMYGKYVHEAVIANGEAESGITIHHVNDEYDEGTIIFQASTAIDPDDTPETLAAKVHELEYQHFPRVVESLLETL